MSAGSRRRGQRQRVEHRLPAARRPPGRRWRSRGNPWPPGRRRSAARRPASMPPWTMPNRACPGLRQPSSGCVRRRAWQRSAQASERSTARSHLLRRGGQRDALVELHLDVGAEQALDLDGALGREQCVEPSMCDWKATPSSVILRSFDRLMTWKPPESVRMGPSQRMKRCRPPSLAMRSAPGRSIR